MFFFVSNCEPLCRSKLWSISHQVSQLGNSDGRNAEDKSLLCIFEKRHDGAQCLPRFRYWHLRHEVTPTKTSQECSWICWFGHKVWYPVCAKEVYAHCIVSVLNHGSKWASMINWLQGFVVTSCSKCNDQRFFAHPMNQHALTPCDVDQQSIPGSPFSKANSTSNSWTSKVSFNWREPMTSRFFLGELLPATVLVYIFLVLFKWEKTVENK